MTITPAIRRNFFLSLAAAVCVLTVGGFLFHDSEVGSRVVPGVAFFGGFILLDVLNAPERRRRESERRTSS